MPPTMLEAALSLAARGFRVVPLHDPGPKGKRPRINDWAIAATTDPATIAGWWTKWPHANVGGAMGGPERIVAIDVDGEAGLATWAAFIDAGLLPHQTLESVSGSGNGGHLFFRLAPHHDPGRIRNSIKFRPGLDVRAEGGQVVLPPSVHESGREYRWADTSIEISILPDWLYDMIATDVSDRRQPSAVSERIPREDPPLIDRIEAARRAVLALPPAISGQGGHNALLVAATVAYRGHDLPRAAAELVVEDYSNRLCTPPWSPAELAHKLAAVESNERVGEHWGYLLDVDDMSAAMAVEPTIETSPVGRIKWMFGDTAAVELPAPTWLVQELQICPGRPTMIAGYGASGKTLIAQSLLLSCAAGVPVWGQFASPRKFTVRHFDHDQGSYATRRRYQRLAKGLGVSLRDLGTRFAFATQPNISLTHADAKRHYLDACADADLVLIDALRGAAAGADENDSRMRECVDVLAWVSEQMKSVAFILIHHAGKVVGEDKRTGPRGSSAIFDGCGCVMQIEAKEGDDAKTVHQTKSAAEAEGGIIRPFALSIEDGSDGALLIRHRELATPRTQDEQMAEFKDAVLLWLEGHPGATKRALRAGFPGKYETKDWALEALLASGAVVNRSADKKGFALFTKNNDPGRFV